MYGRPCALTCWIVALVVGSSTILVALGRSSPQSGLLPFGEWSGTGAFVYEHWSDGARVDEMEVGALATHGEYATTLSIRPGRLDNREVAVMEIRSARGSLPGLESLGNETHLRVALAEAKRLSDHCVLYSLVAFHLNPAPGEPLKSRADAPPFSASCMTAHGYTVLQIAYLDGFVDTFRFDGRHVEKSGTFSVKQRLSQWTECLEASDTARVAAR